MYVLSDLPIGIANGLRLEVAENDGAAPVICIDGPSGQERALSARLATDLVGICWIAERHRVVGFAGRLAAVSEDSDAVAGIADPSMSIFESTDGGVSVVVW